MDDGRSTVRPIDYRLTPSAQDTISLFFSMSTQPKQDTLLGSDPPRYRPRERFWPYVDLSEQLTDEEIAALDPDLHAELFGTPPRPLSVTVVFPVLDSPDYARAVELARASAEYRETGSGASFRHRARFWPADAVKLRDLFEIVGRFDTCEVLVDDRPVPYARELWLPLIWFLIPR
jgi:hypothetical protein